MGDNGQYVTIEVPPLEVRLPLCPICGEETTPDADGAFDCEQCGASWESVKGETGVVEFDGGRCPAMLDAYGHKRWEQVRGRVFRCVYPAAHVETDDPVVHRGIRVDEGAPPMRQIITGRVWDWRPGAPGEFFADTEDAAVTHV